MEYGNAISKSKLMQLYTTMLRIRIFEEKVMEMLFANEIKCPTHLYIGEEAVATGVCASLQKHDYAFGTYRSHGFYIAKGGTMNSLMSELLCKETGCSRGKGGSMHVAAPEIGILGTTAIVGGIIPLAVGTAMAVKMQNDDRIVVSFFGDGATDEGVFYESINFASVRKLPIVFVCENNHYSTHLPLRYRQPADNIYQRVKGFKIPAVRIDGNDVIKTYHTAENAIEHVKSQRGPFFIECETYRWRSHVGPWEDIDVGFRTRKEVEKWKKKCPVKKLEKVLMEKRILDEQEKTQILDQVNKEVAEAQDFARNSAYPEKTELEKDVYRN
jgi:pyruvate dehydrogenase E1 component alpha subunit